MGCIPHLLLALERLLLLLLALLLRERGQHLVGRDGHAPRGAQLLFLELLREARQRPRFGGGVKVQVSNAVCFREGPRAHAPPIATDQPVMKGVQASISMFSGPKMRDIGAAARARGGWGFVAQSAGNRNRARKSGPDARTRARAHHAP